MSVDTKPITLTEIAAHNGFVICLSSSKNGNRTQIMMWKQILNFRQGKVGLPCFQVEIDDAVLRIALRVDISEPSQPRSVFACISKSRIYRYQVHCVESLNAAQPVAKLVDECESVSTESLNCIALDCFGEMVATCEGSNVVVRSEQLRRIRTFRQSDAKLLSFSGSKVVALQFSGSLIIAIDELGCITVNCENNPRNMR